MKRSSSSFLEGTQASPNSGGQQAHFRGKQLADYESVDSRNSIGDTGADLDRETIVSTLFRSESRGKRDRDQNIVQSSSDRKSP